MAVPPIQFATMTDGSRVAFHVLGSGPAVAMLFPYHVNHLTLNRQVPLHRGAMDFLARRFTVINLDFPGAGLSDPLLRELSLPSLSTGLEAVLDAAGVTRLALCAMGAAGLIACDFAATWPDRVTRVAFIASGESDSNHQLLHVRQSAPDVEAEVRGAVIAGVGDKRNALALAEVARHSADPGTIAQWERLLARHDLLAIARGVRAPALYLHAAGDRLVTLPAAEVLTSRLRNGTLKIVPGRSGMDVWRNRESVAELVRFLQGGEDGGQARRAPARSRPPAYPAGLSKREAEVMRLLAAGQTNQQIADELFISLNTVSYHLRHIFEKTGTSNRTEAAAFAFKNHMFG